MLTWPEGTKSPSRAHALDTVQGALDALGLDDRHRGIVVAHADTDSPHVHVLVSRVCPEMGRGAVGRPHAASSAAVMPETATDPATGRGTVCTITRMTCYEPRRAIRRRARYSRNAML